MKLLTTFAFLALTVLLPAHSGTAHAAESACDVRLAQATLRSLDFDAGVVDGLWGRATAAATMAFQTDNDLPASGQLDEVTCSALESARDAGADYQRFLQDADQSFVVRRDWCGRENYRAQCQSDQLLMMSGNLVPCGSTLKTFKDEVGGGMVFPGVHSGGETSCRSLNDFCTYAGAAFPGAFGSTCDGRESFSESACHEKLWGACDQ